MGLFSRKRPSRHEPIEPDYGVFLDTVQGGIAAIIVDLAVKDAAPIAALPYCFTLHVPYDVQTESRLPTEEQLEHLTAIEALMLEAATETVPHQHVATVTTDGNRSVCFYVPSEDSLGPFTDLLIERMGEGAKGLRFTEYDDPKWETYLEDLYPTAEQLAEIRGR